MANQITSSEFWLATDWLIAPPFCGLALALGNIKVIIDCYYSDLSFNLSHHFIVYSVSSMWISLIVCCMFSIGNGPRRNRPPTVAASHLLLSQYYCYWVPATKASWCTIHQSSVLHLPRVLCQSSLLRFLQVHHSPISSVVSSRSVAPITTVASSSSAPFTNLQCSAFYSCTLLQCCSIC